MRVFQRATAVVGDVFGKRESSDARIVLSSTYLLLIVTCYAMAKALRDSLFVVGVGPSQLPVLYVLTAVGMAALSLVYPRALRSKGIHSVIRATWVIAIVSFLTFWWLIDTGMRATFYVLYVWVSLFGAIAVSQVWALASQVFDSRQARRSFAWIGLGGVLGGILGGALAGVVAPWQGAEMLLPICAVLMAPTVFIAGRLKPDERERVDASGKEEGSEGKSRMAGWLSIRGSSYVSTLAGLLIVGVVVEAFVDYQYKAIAYQALDSKDRLTSYFGTITSLGGVLALLVQTLITDRVLRRGGAGIAILMLPAALLAGFLLVGVYPALWAVSVLKLADSCLSYSVHRSGMELLYMPIAEKARASVMAVMDLLVDRGGRAAGGVLLLLLTTGLALSMPALSVVAVVILIVWLIVAVVTRRRYVEAFRDALARKTIEPEGLDGENLDSTTRRALVAALFCEDDRQALYAFNVLAAGAPSVVADLSPTLTQHQSPAVRSRTIAWLTEANLFSPGHVDSRLDDPDLEVRIQAVRHLCERGRHGRVTLKRCLTHSNYSVVLAAIHYIARYRIQDGDLIDDHWIERAVMSPGEDGVSARIAAARALALVESRRARRFLDRLLGDENVDVVRHAVWACGECRYEGSIPLLIPMLGRRLVRREAREALVKMRGEAMSQIRQRLQDDQTPMDIRARIPKVVSQSPDQADADFLLECVHQVSPRLDIPLIKALNRIRTRAPEIQFDEERVKSLIHAEAVTHQRLSAIRRGVRSGREGAAANDSAAELRTLLDTALGERLDSIVERVLRLLHLIYTPTDIRSVYLSVNTRPAHRARAVEFLDNIIDTQLRDVVVPLMEDSDTNSSEERSDELSCDEAVVALMAEGDDWLQSIASALTAAQIPVAAVSR